MLSIMFSRRRNQYHVLNNRVSIFQNHNTQGSKNLIDVSFDFQNIQLSHHFCLVIGFLTVSLGQLSLQHDQKPQRDVEDLFWHLEGLSYITPSPDRQGPEGQRCCLIVVSAEVLTSRNILVTKTNHKIGTRSSKWQQKSFYPQHSTHEITSFYL